MTIKKLATNDKEVQNRAQKKGLSTHNQWVGNSAGVNEDWQQLILFEREAWHIWAKFDKIHSTGLTQTISVRSQTINPDVVQLHKIDDLIGIMPPHIETAVNHIIAGRQVDELVALFHKLAQEAYVSKEIAKRALFIATRTAIIAKSFRDAPEIDAMVKGVNMANSKHNNSDHEKARAEIIQKWIIEREAIIARRGKAQFYRDMQSQYKDKDGNDLIKDTKTIQGWINNWENNLL